jgi:cyclin T
MTSTNAPAFQQSGDFFRLTRAEVESSPSVRDRTFSSWNDELMKRETMCNFIAAMGKQLKLQFPVLVANVFLHCFFSRRSFREYADADVVSAACLFLAAKVEEHRRKVSQVIEAMRIVRDPNAVALHPESPVRRFVISIL